MIRTLLTMALLIGTTACCQTQGMDLLQKMMNHCDSPACCDSGYAEPACGCEVACEPAACGCAEPACGCEAPAAACCEPAPCGCAEPACGCEAPVAGCEVACEPACGCEAPSCGKKGGLLAKLFNHKKRSCCEPTCAAPAACCETAPACGCEVACEPTCDMGCDSGCGCSSKKCGGLLKKLFGNLKKSGCDSGCDALACDSGCGCAPTYSAPMAPAPAPAPAAEAAEEADDASMPPAPIVDPSASISHKRRVIQASARYVR
jgi:hypothetical protein